MQYPFHSSHDHLILDSLVTAVLLLLGLTTSFFIQALADCVFVLGRKTRLELARAGTPPVPPARAGLFSLSSLLLTCLSRGWSGDGVLLPPSRPDCRRRSADRLAEFQPGQGDRQTPTAAFA